MGWMMLGAVIGVFFLSLFCLIKFWQNKKKTRENFKEELPEESFSVNSTILGKKKKRHERKHKKDDKNNFKKWYKKPAGKT